MIKIKVEQAKVKVHKVQNAMDQPKGNVYLLKEKVEMAGSKVNKVKVKMNIAKVKVD